MKIGIDMDGCLVDFMGSAIRRIKTLWGIDINASDLKLPRIDLLIKSKLPEADSDVISKSLFAPGFFISMLPRFGAIKALKELQHEHTLYIITKVADFEPHIIAEKREWLEKYLKGTKYDMIVVGKSAVKQIIDVDIIVDDDPEVLKHPKAIKIAVEHPYNEKFIEEHQVHTIYSMDFLPLIVQMVSPPTTNKVYRQRVLEGKQ
jgi:5'(3')-deoxyribonucleotidase